MTVLIGPFHTLLVVLLLSGTDKLARPDGAAQAMRAAKLVRSEGLSGLRQSRLFARGLGAAEVGVAVATLAATSLFSASAAPWISSGFALVVALVFLGFVWFVARLASMDSTAGCGCFGVAGVPPGAAHQRFNLVATAIAVSSALVAGATSQTLGLSLVAERGPSVWLLYAIVTVVAALMFLVGPSLLASLAPPKQLPTSGAQSTRTFSITEGLSR